MEITDEAAGRLMRIWLVEDDPEFRQAMTFLINYTSGMQCQEGFADAEALLALLDRKEEYRPDIILMDVNLPGLNGIDCISHVKARLPDVKVVMLTIRDDSDTIFGALCAGASGYLLKNAPLDTIIAAIRQAWQGGMLMPGPVARQVLGYFAQQAPPSDRYGLSSREREVLQQMIEGYAQKQIADRLCISPSTVNAHISHIYEKLHVHSSSAAVAKALRERLV